MKKEEKLKIVRDFVNFKSELFNKKIKIDLENEISLFNICEKISIMKLLINDLKAEVELISDIKEIKNYRQKKYLYKKNKSKILIRT